MELHDHIADMVQKINSKYGSSNYEPIVFLERPVPLYEKIALYAISDVCVVTATRDGMNLVPYEYIVCRQAVKVTTPTPLPPKPEELIGMLCGARRHCDCCRPVLDEGQSAL